MGKRKKAAIAAVTTAAAAGLVTGTLFDSPADLMGEPEPAAVVETLEKRDSGTVETLKPLSRLRQWILGLPAAVRMLVGVPLWLLGWILLSALSLLWGGMAPLTGRLLNWLCLALVLTAVFAAAVKAAFPKLSLRRILRPGTLAAILAVTLVLGLADMALPTVWRDYDPASQLMWRLGAACLLAFLCCRMLRRHGKAPQSKPAPAELQQKEIQEIARMLADSVTPTHRN